MSRRKVILLCAIGLFLLLVIGAVVSIISLRQGGYPTDEAVPPNAISESPDTRSRSSNESTQTVGRYADYSEAARADKAYETTILFFYAAWCPECRAFEQAITAEALPDGVQILKVDYDTATDLRQRYGVTLQSTFVRVDTAGDKQAVWVGYGKDKSVDAIIENL